MLRQIGYLGSAKSRHSEWPRAVRLEYPEKCTHRYYADTKAHIGSAETRLPAECTELLLPNNRFLISPQPAAENLRVHRLFFLLSSLLASSPSRQPLCSLLISPRYCAPLFRQFCPRRIAGVIDKTSKSAAHASNKIDSPSYFSGPIMFVNNAQQFSLVRRRSSKNRWTEGICLKSGFSKTYRYDAKESCIYYYNV